MLAAGNACALSMLLASVAWGQMPPVINDHPVCVSLAYVRDQARLGFPDIKGTRIDVPGFERTTVFVSNFSLRQDVGGRLLVNANDTASNGYLASFRYASNFTLGRHLSYWQEVVEGCYGDELPVQCDSRSCATNPPIFRWTIMPSDRSPTADVLIQEAPMLQREVATLQRNAVPGPNPLPAPNSGTVTGTLLGDLLAAYRNPSGFVDEVFSDATRSPFDQSQGFAGVTVSERREPNWRGGNTMVYRYDSVPSDSVIPVNVHDGMRTEINITRPEVLGIKRIHVWDRQLYAFTPEQMANQAEARRVNDVYLDDMARATEQGAAILTCIYHSGQPLGHIVEYWHEETPAAAGREGLVDEPWHPFFKLHGTRADCPPRYSSP